jgi:hypothetical protein
MHRGRRETARGARGWSECWVAHSNAAWTTGFQQRGQCVEGVSGFLPRSIG